MIPLPVSAVSSSRLPGIITNFHSSSWLGIFSPSPQWVTRVQEMTLTLAFLYPLCDCLCAKVRHLERSPQTPAQGPNTVVV